MNIISCKELSEILAVRPEKTTQAFYPALEKVKRVFERYPKQILALLLDDCCSDRTGRNGNGLR